MRPVFGGADSRSTGSGLRWTAVLASLAVHVLVLYFWRFSAPLALPSEQNNSAILTTLEFVVTPPPPPMHPVRKRPPVPAETNRPGTAAPDLTAESVPAADTVAVATQTAPAPAATATGSRNFGDGRLWVRPMDGQELALVHELTRSTAQLADSVVKATIQAYLDSMATELSRHHPPSWVGEIGGRKFGVDSRFVYIAGLKIPSFLLALLPIPGGNQSKAFDRSGQMYDDLRRAVTRSANYDEFKQAIKDLRAQKEYEHQLWVTQQQDPGPEQAPVLGAP